MNESENYLDQLLNAVDGRSDLNDSDPVNPEEIERTNATEEYKRDN